MGKHAEWRKLVKKLRRKRIRTELAVFRDQQLLIEQERRERSPTYQAWLKEQAVIEEFNAAEEKRLAMQRNNLWQLEEEAALLRWREQQSRLAHAKAEKFKKELMIKEEWEREQKKLEEAEEVRKKNEDEKKRKQAELLAQIDAFIEGKADFPDEVNVSTRTQPSQPDCPFFIKTGACRFRDSCSRNHTRPGISRTLLIPNFYDHFGLQTLHHDEYDTDLGLEYEDTETYQHFKEFYKDVLPEFEQCGTLTQFKVCNNIEPHLRGNVYVEYQSCRHALKAYRKFQGRFYAGRRLTVEFTNITSWKNAVCGLFHRQKCPKGKTCNFLHVFRNPNNAFKIQDGYSSSRRQFSRSRSRSPHHRRSRSKDWNWSEGSGSDDETKTKRKRSRSRSRSRVGVKTHRFGNEDNRRKSRSRSRSLNRSTHSKNHDSSKSRRKKHHKERKRNDRHRSKSRSPNHNSKRHKKDHTRDVSRKKDKKSSDSKKDKGDYNNTKSDSDNKSGSSKIIKTDREQKNENRMDKSEKEGNHKVNKSSDSDKKTKKNNMDDSQFPQKSSETKDPTTKKSVNGHL